MHIVHHNKVGLIGDLIVREGKYNKIRTEVEKDSAINEVDTIIVDRRVDRHPVE
jgi:hypothetical protein